MAAVLVVEDEPIVAFDNEHILVQAGYRVVATVNDHDDAVAVMNAGGVDLVIADVALSGARSGIDVARHAASIGVPVLFVTGQCPVEAPELAIGCLSKPFGPRHLIGAIKAVEAALIGQSAGIKLPPGLKIFPRTA